MLGVSPSASEAVPEQTKVLVVTTPVLGEMLAATSKTGSVLSTVTESEEVALAPNVSVMVATQVISSVGALLLAVNVIVAPVPSIVPLLSSQL